MKRPVKLLLAAVAAGLLASLEAAETHDLVIYGSSPAAISAAVQAKRMGISAVIVSPEKRIGGLTTGGLGQTDIGNKKAFGGIALEFYRDVAKYYADPAHWNWQRRADFHHVEQGVEVTQDSMWVFEPHAALEILEGWEKRDGLEIVRGERLDRSKGGVEMKDGRITGFRTESGRVFRGRTFVDATYEGDLMAAAGVRYFVGREDVRLHHEGLGGINRRCAHAHQFAPGVDPYVVKGDPSSGLLPGIEGVDKGELDGTGDRRVQAYCLRMCLTDCPENRIPFKKPAGYDEKDYELLFRNYEAHAKAGRTNFGAEWIYEGIPLIMSRMPNRKTDSNNRGGFSTDFIGQNWNWPDASYAEREEIFKAHLKYQQGLMWTLANHPRVPKAVRDFFSVWGMTKDEFVGERGDGWQNQLYVREARRMVGDYVMTENHCWGSLVAPKPVAMGAYQMDSHHVRRIVGEDGFVRNEGDVEEGWQQLAGHPYGVDYGSIVPKKAECANLFVPVCMSATHMAFGSIRMEPVFFALGQVAGTAAAIAIRDGVAVQDVDYAKLRARLVADGQVVECRDKIVFVEAHPDDLPGHLGTALLLSKHYDVHVIDFTHGELGCGWEKFRSGWTKATRTAEETEVCRRAGFKLHWCDQVDGFAYASSNAVAQLAGYLAEIKPRAVFCHWPLDVHDDHLMSAAATMKAVKLALGGKVELYYHEQDIQSRGFQPAYHVDITETMERKAELTKLYVCQNGDAISKRKAESNRVYGWNSSQRNTEVFGIFHGKVKPGSSVFDSLETAVQ